ncbi:hypothetical protein [Glutamicibacter arilaitensis]|uniref:hypothetical protein n=1 Tax=Glutamicibacter arilaitensis TaxID=256701 RepID=UPI00384EE6CD
MPVPTTSDLGAMLGPGISEELTSGQIKMLNQSRVSQGKKPFAGDFTGIRYFDSGRIVSLDSSGRVIEELASSDVASGFVISDKESPGNFAQVASFTSEAKRVLKACLGLDALTIEALVQELATPKNAVKFVVRRIGVFAAVACAGGIIWEYI